MSKIVFLGLICFTTLFDVTIAGCMNFSSSLPSDPVYLVAT